MSSGPPGTADHLPPRQSTAYRTLASCGGIVLAIAVIGLVRVLATWPSPPPAGTTNEKQVRYGLEHAAGQYADALFAVTRSGPLTEAGLSTVPKPDAVTIETAALSRRGDTTVVTFSARGSYGRPGAREETTACYQVELVRTLSYPTLEEVATSVCAERRR
ncbi:hypothetical protein [Streptomyces sp. NBC_00316]|uniref:hypothetical protein n=1 Tax=Streptomyces sp. NBC_00316 TaxID=2975710 RepID=UPI002E2A30AE|nr:hypothetical protein [Streptomyces sp. NBC_00316]